MPVKAVEIPQTWKLPGDPTSVSAGREYAAQAAAGRFPGLDGDVELLASELLTNALLHGGGGLITLTVSTGNGTLRVAVTDGGSPASTPNVEHPGVSSEHGRGLAIVDALADRWGFDRSRTEGTTVWFELDTAQPKEPPHEPRSGSTRRRGRH